MFVVYHLGCRCLSPAQQHHGKWWPLAECHCHLNSRQLFHPLPLVCNYFPPHHPDFLCRLQPNTFPVSCPYHVTCSIALSHGVDSPQPTATPFSGICKQGRVPQDLPALPEQLFNVTFEFSHMQCVWNHPKSKLYQWRQNMKIKMDSSKPAMSWGR